MTVKEILKSAILFTNNAPLLGLSTFCETSQIVPTTVQQADIDLYLKCFNFVYKEIASAYFPLLEKEEIKFEENKFYIEKLNKIAMAKKPKIDECSGNISIEEDATEA